MRTVDIYTDGACSGNPGPAASVALFVENKADIVRVEKFFEHATNNYAELMAAYLAIAHAAKYYNKYNITLYSDSTYVVWGINNWMNSWKKRNFADIKYNFIWKNIADHLANINLVAKWIKGHSKHKYNILCDRRCKMLIKRNKKRGRLCE